MVQAQNAIRPYALVYSANIKGNTTVLGNSSMHIIDAFTNMPDTFQMNDIANPLNSAGGIGNTIYGNDFSNMQFIDIDENTNTYNSSAAQLILPAGNNTIKFARLYWGGRISNYALTLSTDTLRKVLIKNTNGTYVPILAAQNAVDIFQVTDTETIYQAYADITPYIQDLGSGNYTVANVPASTGYVGSGGNYAGWCMVVAYQNSNAPLNSIRIYDGYYQVFNNNGLPSNLQVNLTGLNVPENPLTAQDAVMTAMSWEGDGNLGATSTNPAGDYLRINNVTVTNITNPPDNFWNGSITKNGDYVHTKTPDYFNQMGIDIDEINVGIGYGIQPNANSVTIDFGTEADQYFPSMFAFSIRMKSPTVTIHKTVQDSDGDQMAGANEILNYTLSGKQIASTNAYRVFIVDTIPANCTYIPGSMLVTDGPGVVEGVQTDEQDLADMSYTGIAGNRQFVKFYMGQGATNNQGGILVPGNTYQVKFKVRAPATPASVINTGTVSASTFSGIEFIDQSTAVMGATGGPVPVQLISFSAALLPNNTALLQWVTAQEINCRNYVLQRSEDAVHFIDITQIEATGNMANTKTYQYTDHFLTAVNTLYYRLAMIDADGKMNFSPVIKLRLKNKGSEWMLVYPNPVTDELKIVFTSVQQQNTTIQVIDAAGKLVLKINRVAAKGENIFIIPNLSHLATGQYQLVLSQGSNKATQSFFKK